MKRLFDFTLSLLALIVFSPVFLFLFFKIKSNLGSPVFFRQKRPGLDEVVFEMIKFRTMKDSVDESGNQLPDNERLTPFGAKLRATSLDELPELINVLKGDMSLVGPRPLLIKYLPYYTEAEKNRHSVRPGITGLAQINGRNSLSWNERLSHDIWYVENRTMLLDFKIILSTLKRVVNKEGLVTDPRSTMLDLDEERGLDDKKIRR